MRRPEIIQRIREGVVGEFVPVVDPPLDRWLSGALRLDESDATATLIADEEAFDSDGFPSTARCWRDEQWSAMCCSRQSVPAEAVWVRSTLRPIGPSGSNAGVAGRGLLGGKWKLPPESCRVTNCSAAYNTSRLGAAALGRVFSKSSKIFTSRSMLASCFSCRA